MGPPLDHHRHFPRRARARPRPHHGRALSVLPPRRQPRRPNQGSRDHPHHSHRTAHHDNIRHGFVYERVPHITLKSIANNAEIDVIWDKWQQTLEPLRQRTGSSLQRESPSGPQGQESSPAERMARSPPRSATNKRLDRKACRAPLILATTQCVVGSPHRPAKGNRRLHRRQGRVRISLRQALRGQKQGPRRRPLHRRKRLAPSRPHRGRERQRR